MDDKKITMVKIVFSCIFTFIFVVSIGLFIASGILVAGAENYTAAEYCFEIGIYSFGLSLLALLEPTWQLFKTFFDHVLFRKRRKK